MQRFKVTKVNIITKKELDFGTYSKNDLRVVLRGYKESKDWFGMYERKNSNWVYFVEQVDF